MTVADSIKEMACELYRRHGDMPREITVGSGLWKQLCDELGYQTRFEKKDGATLEVKARSILLLAGPGKILVLPDGT